MGLFDVDENKIRAMYKRAHVESGGEFVNPRDYRYLDDALTLYAKNNDCSYDEAVRKAKSWNDN